jgi:hypothetical protein
MSEILDQELELLRSMYIDELIETDTSISLRIIPVTFENIA